MTLQANQISWPGIDRTRARFALRALQGATLATLRARDAQRSGRSGHPHLIAAYGYMRNAQGYLGAVGFEKGGRL